MDSTIYNIHSDLLKHVTEKKLKEISVDVISRYKSKDINSLMRYADILELDAAGMNISRLFARIILYYHPDKTVQILKSIEDNYNDNKLPELQRLKRIYIFNRYKPVIPDKKYDIDIEETYSYSDEYFGRDEKEKPDNETYEDEDYAYDDINPAEYGFIEAVNRLVFGGIDDFVTAEDLNNIEGELDLSGSDIADLKGVEHCRNITILNLSGNHIDKIERLSGLEMLELLYISENNIEFIGCLENLRNLKELDISFNSVEDISVLLKLDELVYVNVMENPIKNKDVIKELEDRGVIVIY